MRIQRRDSCGNDSNQLSEELSKAIHTNGIEGRVCSTTCAIKCDSCGSKSCQCMCSTRCPDALKLLSAEPERYPIEPIILPLVFEMKRLGMFVPCWSCEGHLQTDGTVWKVPRVWFYCEAPVYLRLLSDGLNGLKHNGKLNNDWHIVVAFSDRDNPETTYSLEPRFKLGDNVLLPSLQQDIGAIAIALQSMLTQEARSLSRTAKSS